MKCRCRSPNGVYVAHEYFQWLNARVDFCPKAMAHTLTLSSGCLSRTQKQNPQHFLPAAITAKQMAILFRGQRREIRKQNQQPWMWLHAVLEQPCSDTQSQLASSPTDCFTIRGLFLNKKKTVGYSTYSSSVDEPFSYSAYGTPHA